MSALLRGPNTEPRASTKLDETLTLLTVCGRGVDVCSVSKSAAGFQERVSCEARAGRSVGTRLIVFPSGNYELLAAPFFRDRLRCFLLMALLAPAPRRGFFL
jgi:hypothetical protein